MKIEDLNLDEDHRRRRAQELRDLMTQPTARQQRVCPGCDIRCAQCGSISCTCSCAPDCADAPQQMSSDPEKHPVEAGIVPLVYALNELRVFHPCWSCEGHVEDDGRLIRPPHVWFSVRTTVYLSLINHCLFHLHFEKKLSRDWQIKVVDWGQTEDSGFSLEPVTAKGEKIDLAALRRDVRVIAEGLLSGVRAAATHYIDGMASTGAA